MSLSLLTNQLKANTNQKKFLNVFLGTAQCQVDAVNISVVQPASVRLKCPSYAAQDYECLCEVKGNKLSDLKISDAYYLNSPGMRTLDFRVRKHDHFHTSFPPLSP